MNHFYAPNCQDCPSRRSNMLHCCSETDINSISTDKISHQYAPGQAIFREGSRSVGLYCVHSGKIKIAKSGGDGKEQIIRLVRAGDLIGYRSLIAGSPHSTSAVALSDCTVCLIPKQVFSQHMHSNPQFADSMLHLLADALGETSERMLHLAYKPVRERLAEALLLLLRTYRSEGDALPFSMAITREDLGALMGTTKETTTRMLSEFKDEGILTTRGSAITILAPVQLVEIATQFD